MKGTNRPRFPISQKGLFISAPTIPGIGEPPLIRQLNNEVEEVEDGDVEIVVEENVDDVEEEDKKDPKTGHYMFYGKWKDFKHKPKYGPYYAVDRKGHNKYEIIPGPEVDENTDRAYGYIYLDKEYLNSH